MLPEIPGRTIQPNCKAEPYSRSAHFPYDLVAVAIDKSGVNATHEWSAP
jgi:hypothetical protein